MPSEERNKNQEDFVYDRVNIIIAILQEKLKIKQLMHKR